MAKITNENRPDHTLEDDVVFEAEKKYLHLDGLKSISGIAVSGGGIRSASFGMGVMQSLVSNNQLARMDYMSTVSGGGYLGSALTWALKLNGARAGVTPDSFPLGKRGAHKDKDDSDDKSTREHEGNELLDFIRQHGSYLTPTKNLDIVSFAAIVMRSMLMSLFVYINSLIILLTTSLWLIYKIVNIEFGNSTQGALLVVGVIIIVCMLLMGLFYSLRTYSTGIKSSKSRYKSFIRGQKMLGWMLKISLTCFLFGSLPYVADLLNQLYVTALAASGSTIFGAAVGFWQYLKASKNEKNSGGSSDILIYSGAFALFYGILLLAYIISRHVFLDDSFQFQGQPVYWIIWLILITGCLGYFVNLNYLGPHYVWRSRLMEAFLPNPESVKTNSWGAATKADSALMEEMCDSNNPWPYHIINTNAILANSQQIDFSGRGGDNFIISPLYCGSDATGWKTTKTFQKNKTRGMTLASAMATSAAALNPNAGVSGEGVTRNVVVSLLLSILNLRLGYWTSNPSRENTLGSPNFFVPGLTTEIFRFGFTEKHRNLLLSDGGHYENLGLYELIRRKLNLIVVSDGGSDPNFNLDDLANAIEKVRVDFGARIYFKEGFMPGDLLPGTAGDSFFQKKYQLAKHGYAFADIIYSDNSKGTLVYIKLAMIEGLSTDVYSYKGINPSFPHQSTSDQFFDEKQFEAYRELGYYVGWQMMNSEEGKKIFPANDI